MVGPWRTEGLPKSFIYLEKRDSLRKDIWPIPMHKEPRRRFRRLSHSGSDVVQPGKAELAFVVIDQYQGQGIGSALLRHLIVVARAAGLHEFIADVFAENSPMLRIFENCDLPTSAMHENEYVHVTLRLA